MDIIDEYLPGLAPFYNTFLLPYLNQALTHSPLLARIHATLLHLSALFYTYLCPLLYPLYRLSLLLLTRLLTTLSTLDPSNPSTLLPQLWAPVALLLLFLVSLRALDLLRRQVLFWVRLGIRLGFWMAVGCAGYFVYVRGVEQAARDVGWVVGLLRGWEDEGRMRGEAKGWEREARARRGYY